jgi:hypothetical protein
MHNSRTMCKEDISVLSTFGYFCEFYVYLYSTISQDPSTIQNKYGHMTNECHICYAMWEGIILKVKCVK